MLSNKGVDLLAYRRSTPFVYFLKEEGYFELCFYKMKA
jgi:hypothetical protein